MNVEVGEENDEGRGIRNEGVVHPLGEVAVDVQRVHAVESSATKLELKRDRGREGEGERGGLGQREGRGDGRWD